MRGLKGKNVLVTGGSSGIGQAIAVRFAEHGANVAINYLTTPDEAAEHRGDGPRLPRARAPAGRQGRARPGRRLQGGRRDPDGRADGRRARLASTCSSTTPASRSHGPRTSSHRPTSRRCSRVNLRGAFLCARESIKRFLDAGKGGVIVNVSSVHQDIPKPDYLGYSVSKGGMRNLTRTLALEYAGDNIRVNAIGPGRHDHADQPRVGRRPGEGRAGHRPTSRSGGRAPPTRWRASPASSRATTPPTSPDRRSSSTAA